MGRRTFLKFAAVGALAGSIQVIPGYL
ncbi:twin-arginine translocation signal domain-containing protein [Desulfobotulus mexicanus]